MSIDLRISDKPFIADILFKDGTRRRIDYYHCSNYAGFFILTIDKPADAETPADSILVNCDSIATCELAKAASTVGSA